jgi:hypothetical protein
LATGSALYFSGTNFGIATTNPTRLLEIGTGSVSKTAIGQSLISLSANSGNVGYVNEIGFGGSGTTNVQSAIGNIVTDATAASNGALYFATRSVTTDTAPTERLRISSAGDVGIGTSSPSFKTEIVGGATTVETTLLQLSANAGGVGTGSAIAFCNSTNPVAGSGRVELAGIREASNGGSFIIRTGDSSGTIQNRVKITDSGLVGINIFTTPASGNTNAKLVVKGSGGSDVCEVQVTTNGVLAFDFRNSSGTQAGSITINSSSVAYNTSSDYRLKNTIAPITGALAKVAQLKPVTYKWNVDGSDGEGFIAHELAEICPSAVTGAKDAVDADGNIKPQGIDVSFLVATLTSALQELDAKFEAYKASHP